MAGREVIKVMPILPPFNVHFRLSKVLDQRDVSG